MRPSSAEASDNNLIQHGLEIVPELSKCSCEGDVPLIRRGQQGWRGPRPGVQTILASSQGSVTLEFSTDIPGPATLPVSVNIHYLMAAGKNPQTIGPSTDQEETTLSSLSSIQSDNSEVLTGMAAANSTGPGSQSVLAILDSGESSGFRSESINSVNRPGNRSHTNNRDIPPHIICPI